jgi:excisionase family DNA binding protein
MVIEKQNEEQELLTVHEAAEQANVTQAAIRNAIYRGKLPAKQIYGRLLIARKEFEKYRAETKIGRPKQEKQQA